MKLFGRSFPVRRPLYILLGWIHCTLLLAPIYTLVTENFFRVEAPPEEMTMLQLRALLFIVPVALSWLAAHYIRRIVLYIPASALVCALTWFVFRTVNPPALSSSLDSFDTEVIASVRAVIPVIVTVVLCFLRMYGRIIHEDHSMLDHANFPGLLVVGAPMLVSFFVKEVNESFQHIGLLFVALYFLVIIGQKGIQRISGYVDTNRALANFPERRIVRLLSVILVTMIAVTAVISVPALLANDEVTRIELPKNTASAEPTATPAPEAPPSGGGQMDMMEGLGDAEPNPFFAAFFKILEYLVFAAVGVFVVVGVVVGVIHISRSFSSSYNDRGDFVENLQDDDVAALSFRRPKRDRPGILDRSPNAVIRRRWRKAVLRAKKDPPSPAMSPAEAEAHAGLAGEDAARLHLLYEKARYSETGADREDLHF